MENIPATDHNHIAEPMSEPVELTEEQAHQIAAGLAQVVAGLTGRGCPTCGIGALFQAA